jgi:hypothetical protein
VVEHWDGSYELIEYSNFVKKFTFPEHDAPLEEEPVAAGPQRANDQDEFPIV